MTIHAALDAYLAYLQAARSLNTRRTYAIGLRHFTRYLATLGIDANQAPVTVLERQHALDFVAWLYTYLLERSGGRPEKISESTKNTYYQAVGGFYEYLVLQAGTLPLPVADYDRLRKVLADAAHPPPRQQLPPDKLPSHAIIEALLAAAQAEPDLSHISAPGDQHRRRLAWLRDRAIIEALLSSGLRVGELVRLERGHLLYEVQGALVKYGKGKKEREVLFSPQAWESIQAYLAARDAHPARSRQVAALPVFARHDRRSGTAILPLSTRSVQNTFFELAVISGIVERFHLTPHTLRHFFATEFLSQTGDLALTQYALGHTSPLTTRIYAQTKREDFRLAHRQVFRKEKKTVNRE